VKSLLRAPREPVNAWTHWAGAVAGALLLWPLLAWAGTHGVARWPFVVFDLSLVALYAASASYHSFSPGGNGALWLRKLDHAAIFLLIAGTYTPVAFLGLAEPQRSRVLALIWGIALLGIGLKLFTLKVPRWLSTALYVGMGWLAVGFLPQLSRQLPHAAIVWLALGGVLYTLGAFGYATKRPRTPRRLGGLGTWGFHELWHLFVLGGSAAHVVMMFNLR
jgi:channel protein, hemolysin III family